MRRSIINTFGFWSADPFPHFLGLNLFAFFLKYSISCCGVMPSISFEISSLLFLMKATASKVFFVFGSVFITLIFLLVFLFLKPDVRF